MTDPARLVLVRHAQPLDAGAMVYGRLDVELGEAGREQAARLAEALGEIRIDAIYTSPLTRARDTAAPLAARVALEPSVVPDLRELDFGDLEGLPFEEVKARHAGLLAWTIAPCGAVFPGGESVADLHRRAVAATRAIAAGHAGTTVVLVSHSVTLRAILTDALGMTIDSMFRLDIPHCSISVVDWYGEHPYVRSVNGGVPAE